MEKDMNSLEYLQSKENYDSWRLSLHKDDFIRYFPTLKYKWKSDKEDWKLIMYDRWNERHNSPKRKEAIKKQNEEFHRLAKEMKDNFIGVSKAVVDRYGDMPVSDIHKNLGHTNISNEYTYDHEDINDDVVEPNDMISDPIVNSVISQFEERSKAGIKKYGTTLKDNNTDDFFQHLKEELMDAILYLEKLQQEKKDLMNAIIENIDKQEYRDVKGY